MQNLRPISPYNDNPPAELVQQTIESIFEQEGKRLSYEEAAKIVPSSLIDNYILTEINMKKKLFDEFGDNNPEELKKILDKDMEQTRTDFANANIPLKPSAKTKTHYQKGAFIVGNTKKAEYDVTPIVPPSIFDKAQQILSDTPSDDDGIDESPTTLTM